MDANRDGTGYVPYIFKLYTAAAAELFAHFSQRMPHQSFRLLMHNMSRTLSITQPNLHHPIPSHAISFHFISFRITSSHFTIQICDTRAFFLFFLGLNKSPQINLSYSPKIYKNYMLFLCRLSTAWIHTHWMEHFSRMILAWLDYTLYIFFVFSCPIHAHTRIN